MINVTSLSIKLYLRKLPLSKQTRELSNVPSRCIYDILRLKFNSGSVSIASIKYDIYVHDEQSLD